MQDEYGNEIVEVIEPAYSTFWPLLILLVGLILWFGYQAYSAYAQKSALNDQFDAALPQIQQAQGLQQKLYALAQDLIQTGAKDPYAAQIVKEANIQVRPNGNAAAPAATP